MTDKATLEEIEAVIARGFEPNFGWDDLTHKVVHGLLEICREQGERIKRLENPWRHVEDELPEDKQDVGFIMHWPGNWNHQRIMGGRFHAGRDYSEFSVPGLATEATHWFPMPKKP